VKRAPDLYIVDIPPFATIAISHPFVCLRYSQLPAGKIGWKGRSDNFVPRIINGYGGEYKKKETDAYIRNRNQKRRERVNSTQG
jgi:hypothetical protein